MYIINREVSFLFYSVRIIKLVIVFRIIALSVDLLKGKVISLYNRESLHFILS